MEDANAQLPVITKDQVDAPVSVNILEARPHICPLCNSVVKLFFINFNEKILMCANTDCEYPFGHEDIKFYKDISDNQSVDDACSNRSINTPSVAPSTISSSGWTDIDHMNKIYESEENQLDFKSFNDYKDKNIKTQIEKASEEQLNKNVANIKELTKALIETNERQVHCINNEKWIKNLMSKQISGMKLLRQGEMKKVKTTELALGTTELKIDFDTSENKVSSITIELAQQ